MPRLIAAGCTVQSRNALDWECHSAPYGPAPPIPRPEIFGALPAAKWKRYQPQFDIVALSEKVCIPLISNPKANSPLPTCIGPRRLPPDFGVMARYDRFTVYFPGRIRRMQRQQGCTQNKGGSPGGPGQISGRDFSDHIGSGLGFVFHLKVCGSGRRQATAGRASGTVFRITKLPLIFKTAGG